MGNSTSKQAVAASVAPSAGPTTSGPVISLPFPLPPDIQLHIYEVADDHDLLALRLVNKEVSRFAEAAFIKAFFTERRHAVTRYSLKALAEITAYPRLATRLRHLQLVFMVSKHVEWDEGVRTQQCWGDEGYTRWCEEGRADITGLLCTIFTNLKTHFEGPLPTLTVTDGYYYDRATVFGLPHGDTGRAPSHLVPALLSAIAKTSFPFENLVVKSGWQSGSGLWKGAQFASRPCSIDEELLPPLRESLTTLREVHIYCNDDTQLRDGSFVDRILRSATSIETFRAAGDRNVWKSLPQLEIALTGHRLKTLRLQGINGPSNTFMSFLASHRDTLTGIFLRENSIPHDECWMPVIRYMAELPVLAELEAYNLDLYNDNYMCSVYHTTGFGAIGRESIKQEIDRFFAPGFHYVDMEAALERYRLELERERWEEIGSEGDEE